MLQSLNPQLISGVSTFLTEFTKLSQGRSRSKLATTLHQFGWETAATTVLKAGQLCHRKCIAVQVNKGKDVASCPTKALF